MEKPWAASIKTVDGQLAQVETKAAALTYIARVAA